MPEPTPVNARAEHGELRRSLGVFDAVVIGMGSMIGAGIFAALAPAARAAGSGLLLALALAAVVAYCNATSSARLAARYPASGGTYVYGRKRLGDFWGYLAGWGFVVGKTASCAAMALTVGFYAWPAQAHAVAVAAVVALTAVNYAGVQKSAWLTRAIVAAVLAVLAAVIVAAFTSAAAGTDQLRPGGATLGGVIQAAGLLFFAFAGYARIATLGEEVRDPARTIPRAIPLALSITLAVYALVSVAALSVLGPSRLAQAGAPLVETVRAAGTAWLVPVVQAGAVIAAVGSLLALILGVSRTTLAMARDRHLPHALAAVHPRSRVPHRAELLIGAVVAILAAATDLRDAIGFSSFAVLIYYAIANASAFTLRPDEGRPHRAVPVIGLLGCVVLAFAMPLWSVLSGVAVLGLGVAAYLIRRLLAQRGCAVATRFHEDLTGKTDRMADPGTDAFEKLVALLNYPMFVVTTQADDTPAGCLVGFASQTSIHPPRFMVGLSRRNHTFRIARDATHLAVHVFDHEHLDVVELFGGQTGDEVDKFDRCSWHRGPEQMPILNDAAAWFVGEIVERFSLGDHVGHLLAPMNGRPPTELESWVSFGDVRHLEPGHEA